MRLACPEVSTDPLTSSSGDAQHVEKVIPKRAAMKASSKGAGSGDMRPVPVCCDDAIDIGHLFRSLKHESGPDVVLQRATLLVCESRVPQTRSESEGGVLPVASSRGGGGGYSRGHHFPPAVNRRNSSHTCSQSDPQCVETWQRLRLMRSVLESNTPLVVEVWLVSDCCATDPESLNTAVDSVNCESAVLIEVWTFQKILKRGFGDSGIVVGGVPGLSGCDEASLYQAITSHLSFSQLASWLVRSRGTSPKHIHYRLCAGGDVLSPSSKLTQNSFDSHTFPTCNPDPKSAFTVSVQVLHLKRDIYPEGAPQGTCRVHQVIRDNSRRRPSESKLRNEERTDQRGETSGSSDLSSSPESIICGIIPTHKKKGVASVSEAVDSSSRSEVRRKELRDERRIESSAIDVVRNREDVVDVEDAAVDEFDYGTLEFKAKSRKKRKKRELSGDKRRRNAVLGGRGREREGNASGGSSSESNSLSDSLDYLCETLRFNRTSAAVATGTGSERVKSRETSNESSCRRGDPTILVSKMDRNITSPVNVDLECSLENLCLQMQMHSLNSTTAPSSGVRSPPTPPPEDREQDEQEPYSDEGFLLSSQLTSVLSQKRDATYKNKTKSKRQLFPTTSKPTDGGDESGNDSVFDGSCVTHPDADKVHKKGRWPWTAGRCRGANSDLYSANAAVKQHLDCSVGFSIGANEVNDLEQPYKSQSHKSNSYNSSSILDQSGKSFQASAGELGPIRSRKSTSGDSKDPTSVAEVVAKSAPQPEMSHLKLLVPGDQEVPVSPSHVGIRTENDLVTDRDKEKGVNSVSSAVDVAAVDPSFIKRAFSYCSPTVAFNSNTGLPLSSSPVAFRRMSKSISFHSKDGLLGMLDSSCGPNVQNPHGISPSTLHVHGGQQAPDVFRPRSLSNRTSQLGSSASSSSSSQLSLVVNFEESVLKGRMEPFGVIEGFKADIGAAGLKFCPKHASLDFSACYYNLSNDGSPSPYFGYISLDKLGKRGYRVPRRGQVQVTLFNPSGSVIKVFIVMYDLNEMPSHHQTFLRQRTFLVPKDEEDSSSASLLGCSIGPKSLMERRRKPILKYLLHLRFQSSSGNKIYLHTDIRCIFSRSQGYDSTGLDQSSFGKDFELKTFTEVPKNPQFSPSKP